MRLVARRPAISTRDVYFFATVEVALCAATRPPDTFWASIGGSRPSPSHVSPRSLAHENRNLGTRSCSSFPAWRRDDHEREFRYALKYLCHGGPLAVCSVRAVQRIVRTRAPCSLHLCPALRACGSSRAKLVRPPPGMRSSLAWRVRQTKRDSTTRGTCDASRAGGFACGCTEADPCGNRRTSSFRWHGRRSR